MIPKLTFAAFVAFWASAATLVALWVLTPRHVPGGPEVIPRIDAATLAEHSTPDDCWMAIEGHVHDLTSYLPEHPTAGAVIADWCGKEATEGMRTKGYGQDHSPTAWAMLERYRIGTFVEPQGRPFVP